MCVIELFEYQFEVMLFVIDFVVVDQMLCYEVDEYGLDLYEGYGCLIWCEIQMGEFGVKKCGDDVLIFVCVYWVEWLFLLQEIIVYYLVEILLDKVCVMCWLFLVDVGKILFYFSFVCVGQVQCIVQDFICLCLYVFNFVWLVIEDLIYFCLVLFFEGDFMFEWLCIVENGQIVWFLGVKVLYCLVYIVCYIDFEVGWLDIDIFVYDGGCVMEWVCVNFEGCWIGLFGLGGGGIFVVVQLILVGDEIVYFVFVWMMQFWFDVMGQVYLLGMCDDYLLLLYVGLQVIYLFKDEVQFGWIFVEKFFIVEIYLWMVLEKMKIIVLCKLIFNELGYDKVCIYFVGYWMV